MNERENISTYIRWRGDLPVSKVPFNEVDALILSELVYLDFAGIVPGIGEEGVVTVQQAFSRYEKKHQKLLNMNMKEEMFEQLADAPRFADMTLRNYVSDTDIGRQEQFAAMHVDILPSLTFVAFRGTDSTIVGWREDFNMSYMMPVPAQTSAAEYLNRTLNGLFHKYWIGGHSKGGNLAIYAAVFCNQKLQKRIVHVNSFDGPGFPKSMVGNPAYNAVKDRIHSYVPESSIVGMLMEHEEHYKVVKSSEYLLLQHEGLSWQVYRDAFVLVDEIDAKSRKIRTALRRWLENVSMEERKAMVDALFGVFEQAALVDLDDLSHLEAKQTAALIKAVATVPKKERDVVGKLVYYIIDDKHL